MCGIFGLWSRRHPLLSWQLVQQATEVIRHRGPDDEGYLLVNIAQEAIVPCGGQDTDRRLNLPKIGQFTQQAFDLAFGFRRLAILDLSETGHQPMSYQDGRYWIVFNGEIYNYLELRAELEKKGYAFRSTSDTEVLVASYAEWGAGALNKFIGMFAFCILDLAEKKLFLARDFFGIKPLYYIFTPDCFAFASEIKQLMSIPWLKREVDPQSLYWFLRYSISDATSRTMFREVLQLPPAHYLEIDLQDDRQPTVSQYWKLGYPNNRGIALSFDEAARELRRLFLESIRLHLRSDVPIGAALSGGIDSSAIVMGMRQIIGHQLDLHTFSFIADTPAINEEKWIDLVSREARSQQHKTLSATEQLVDDLSNLIYHQDEPFGTTSIYAQYRVFQLAQQAGIKVMEDGQGSDELFAGYQPYTAARLASLVRQFSLRRAWNLWRASITELGLPRSLVLRRMTGFLIPDRFRRWARRVSAGAIAIPWLNQSWFQQRSVSFPDFFSVRSAQILKDDLHYAVTQTSLPVLLHYEDRNSMAFSIESRVPFLTPALAEFVFSLPEEYILNDQALTKAVLRKAMHGIVPEAVLARRDKIGFQTPEKDWLLSRQAWVDRLLRGEIVQQMGALNVPKVLSEWESIKLGQKPYGSHIWRWIIVVEWASRFGVTFRF